MTQGGRFKRQVRARMRATGENYLAARSALRPTPAASERPDKEAVMAWDVDEQDRIIGERVAQKLGANHEVQILRDEYNHLLVNVVAENPEAAAGRWGRKLQVLQRELAIELNEPKILVQVSLPFEQFTCSFCGKNKSEVAHLVAGPNANICDECVAVSMQIITEQGEGRLES